MAMNPSSFRRQLTDNWYWNNPDELMDWMYLCLAILCIVSAALASGLTLGLLSLDRLKLKSKLHSGTKNEKNYAASVLPIVDPTNHHYLLVTLLVYNALAAESLPILMAKLVPDLVAVVISVFIILIFGEIIPTSIFTGENQLAITSYLIPLVYFLQILFFPIAYPLSKLLDAIFGIINDELSDDDIAGALTAIFSNTVNKLPTVSSPSVYGSDGNGIPNSEIKPLLSETTSLPKLINRDDIQFIRSIVTLSSNKITSISRKMSGVMTVREDEQVTKELIAQCDGFKLGQFIPVLSSLNNNVVIGAISLQRLTSSLFLIETKEVRVRDLIDPTSVGYIFVNDSVTKAFHSLRTNPYDFIVVYEGDIENSPTTKGVVFLKDILLHMSM